MRHNERNYDRDDRRQGGRSNDEHNLSNYLSRYQDSGHYYGMPDQEHEYRNMRSQGSNRGGSPGPAGGYGANSRQGGQRDNDSRTQGRMHQNEWGGGGSHRSHDRENYGNRSNQDHYRYGDPNPYMNYERNGGYERTRGTGWRNEDVDHSNKRYSRQDNSYQSTGHGRRYDQYGRDEHYNYAHGQQDGRRSIQDPENLDDRYYDRGEHSRRRSDNDYGSNYGANYDHRNSNRQGRDDNYESRRYSSRNEFNRGDSGGSPNRSPRGYGHPSGPDYSADSPLTNYGPGVRGHQK